MPVKIGDNLTIEDNKLSAVYKELYTKLNRAYAWTWNNSTSSGGTAMVFYNGSLLQTISCSDVNSIKIVRPGSTGFQQWYINSAIINNTLYTYYNGTLTQRDITNAKMATCNSYGSETIIVTENGELRRVSNSNTTSSSSRIGSESNWTYFPEYYTAYPPICGINNNKIYKISNSYSSTNLLNNTNFSKFVNGLGITSEGYLYTVNENNGTITLKDSSNIWVDIHLSKDSSFYFYILNNNDELYWYYDNKLTKILSNVKKYVVGYYGTTVLTNDNKLYYVNGSNVYQIINNNIINWFDISSPSYYTFHAIGDGKLYYITAANSSPVFTQIGTESSFMKLEGMSSSILVAWTGEATYYSKTVYTTKTPLNNDDIYSDNNLTKYSLVTQTSDSPKTITDIYRTYERDLSKDTYFTKIPSASIHETITAIDILSATNPNN